MDLETKRAYIRDFMQRMTEHALTAAAKMPEDWDGHELRTWLADEFAHETSALMREKRSRRMRKYRNDVAVIAGL